MPVMIPLRGIRVVRDGKKITPRIGRPFDFTADEVRDLRRSHPNHIREPKNENPDILAPVSTGPTQNIDPLAANYRSSQDRIPDVNTRVGQVVPERVSQAPIPEVQNNSKHSGSTDVSDL